MKFLVFGPRLWNSTWGHAQELCLHLAKKNEVVYVEPLRTSNVKRPNSLRETAKNRTHKNITVLKSKKEYKLGISYACYSNLRNEGIAEEMDYDVLIFYDALTAYGLINKKAWTIKVFNFVDECLLTKKWAKMVYQNVFLSRALTRSDLVITTAKALYDKAKKCNKKVYLLPNGVNLNQFKNAGRNKKIIGFVGSLGFWINAELLVKLANHFKNYEFWIAGGGVQYDYLLKNKPVNMKLLGFINHEKVPAFLNKLSIGLIPFNKSAVTDAVNPVKLFEYWASGTPVVATHTKELRKLKCAGLLLSKNDEEWIQNINSLLQDKNWQVASKTSLIRVKGFDWKVLGDKYEEIVRQNFNP